MEKQEILDKVIELLQDRGFEEAATEGQLLSTHLGLDSLDMIELQMDCEKEFKIVIPDHSYWRTVSDVVETVSNMVEELHTNPGTEDKTLQG